MGIDPTQEWIPLLESRTIPELITLYNTITFQQIKAFPSKPKAIQRICETAQRDVVRAATLDILLGLVKEKLNPYADIEQGGPLTTLDMVFEDIYLKWLRAQPRKPPRIRIYHYERKAKIRRIVNKNSKRLKMLEMLRRGTTEKEIMETFGDRIIEFTQFRIRNVYHRDGHGLRTDPDGTIWLNDGEE